MNPQLNGVTFKQLSQADNTFLTTSFEMEEIREAVWDCDGDKSPGPNRFNFKFIKSLWHMFQHDFKKVLDDFYLNGVWPKGSNASFIALIPKIHNHMGLNDFRPISLVDCMYKVVAKLLANILKAVLHKLIHDNQFAFLGGGGTCLIAF